METVNINAPGYKMKGSPMLRNFNVGIANKTGVSGLATKSSPMQLVWLVAIGKAIAGAAKVAAATAKVAGAKIAAGATKVAGKIAGTFGAKSTAGKLAAKSSKLTSLATKAKASKLASMKNLKATKIGKTVGKVQKFMKTPAGQLTAKGVSSMTAPQPEQEKNTSISDAVKGISFGNPGSSSVFTYKKSALRNIAYAKYMSTGGGKMRDWGKEQGSLNIESVPKTYTTY